MLWPDLLLGAHAARYPRSAKPDNVARTLRDSTLFMTGTAIDPDTEPAEPSPAQRFPGLAPPPTQMHSTTSSSYSLATSVQAPTSGGSGQGDRVQSQRGWGAA